MLKLMRRGITTRRSEELLEQIREAVPGIALRTTLLVGHPGETEDDFQQLYDFVKRFRFNRLGVFTYSHEENTHAHTLEDDVPQEVKEERAGVIMELQREISDELNREMLGREYKVMFDRMDGEYFVGRTEYDSPEVDNEVLVPVQGNYVRLGDFARVRITETTPYDLYGTLV